jgi:hypothetical protein
VVSIKGIDELLRVSKVSSWFPAVVTGIVAFPFDKVLILVVILTTIQNAFNFIFKFVSNLDQFRGWWSMFIDFITMPWRETINMKDWVLPHGWGEEKLVSKVTCTFNNVI